MLLTEILSLVKSSIIHKFVGPSVRQSDRLFGRLVFLFFRHVVFLSKKPWPWPKLSAGARSLLYLLVIFRDKVQCVKTGLKIDW